MLNRTLSIQAVKAITQEFDAESQASIFRNIEQLPPAAYDGITILLNSDTLSCVKTEKRRLVLCALSQPGFDWTEIDNALQSRKFTPKEYRELLCYSFSTPANWWGRATKSAYKLYVEYSSIVLGTGYFYNNMLSVPPELYPEFIEFFEDANRANSPDFIAFVFSRLSSRSIQWEYVQSLAKDYSLSAIEIIYLIGKGSLLEWGEEPR